MFYLSIIIGHYYFLWYMPYSKHFTGIIPFNLHSHHQRVRAVISPAFLR